MAEEEIEIKIKEVYWAAVSKKSVWYDCEWQPKAYNQPHYFIGSGWGSNGTYYKAWYSCIEVDLTGQQGSETKYLKIILHSDPKSGVWIPEKNIVIAAGLSQTPPNSRDTKLPTSFINDEIYFLKNSEGKTLSNKQGTEETGIFYLKIPPSNTETLKKCYIYLFSANEVDGKPTTSDQLWWRGYCETTKYRQGIEAYLTDSNPFDDDPDNPDTPGDTPDNPDNSLSISLFYQNSWKKASPFICHNKVWYKVKNAWIYDNDWKQIKKE